MNDPRLLFNVGQCYRQLGEPEEAALFYRNYRRLATPADHGEVDRLIDQMERAAASKRQKEIDAALTIPSPIPSTGPSAEPSCLWRRCRRARALRA